VHLQLLPRRFYPVVCDGCIDALVSESQHAATFLTIPVVFEPGSCMVLSKVFEILDRFRLYFGTNVVKCAIATSHQQILEQIVIRIVVLFVFIASIACAFLSERGWLCRSGKKSV
jgi:hypothetical protein